MDSSLRETDSCRIFVAVFTTAQYRLYPGSHQPSPRALPYIFTSYSCLILDIPGGQFRSGVPTYTYGVLIGLIRATSPAHPAINYLVLTIFCEQHILQRTSKYILPPYIQIFSWAPPFLKQSSYKFFLLPKKHAKLRYNFTFLERKEEDKISEPNGRKYSPALMWA